MCFHLKVSLPVHRELCWNSTQAQHGSDADQSHADSGREVGLQGNLQENRSEQKAVKDKG